MTPSNDHHAILARRRAPARASLSMLAGAVFALSSLIGGPAGAATAPAHPLERADLEPWLDGLMTPLLTQGDIAGAVVVVVKGDQVVLQKGFGYADVASHRPVDPEKTLFRIGSISKLFTWTAVMQLVEQGKIDLDKDVNTYLDFKLPDRSDGPITMRNLMTHRPGFEEDVKGLIHDDPKDRISNEAFLKRYAPARIFAAGSTPAYSNYGAALAGYIVQRISGEKFEDYIAAHLYAPLGMTHASFEQPLPAALAPDVASGYELASKPAKGFEFVDVAPAGSMAASGESMARFMIAELKGGGPDPANLLKPETMALMRTPQKGGIEPLNQMLLGFYESNIPGHRGIGHGGDTGWSHSDLRLYVDDGIGLFVSFNSLGRNGAAGTARSQLMRSFGERYLPAPTDPAPCLPADAAKADALLMAGEYESTRRIDSSFASLTNLFTGTTVTPVADGHIMVSGEKDLNGAPVTLCEIAPHVWRNMTGPQKIAALVKDGRVVRIGLDYPFMAFEPTPGYRSPAWLLPSLGVAIGAILLTALGWPVGAIARANFRVPRTATQAATRTHRWSQIAALGLLVVLGAYAGVLISLSGGGIPSDKSDTMVLAAQAALLLATLGVFGVALWRFSATWTGPAGWFSRLWSLVFLVSMGIFAWVVIIFHLASLNVNY